jgi:ribosomal protein S18 acetylase RimI-like enzyme
MQITLVVAKQLPHLKKEWEAFLALLNGYECTVKNSYPISMDTSIAEGVLNGQIPLVSCAPSNLEALESRQKFVEFLIEMDAYSFRNNHSREFLNKMLKPKEARAFVAQQENRIVGGLWGFFTQYEGKKIFHAWLLVIRPDFSSLGVGKQLIEFAKQQSQNYPDVTLATLNVDHFNRHAKMLYDKEDFISLSDQKDKNFMGRSLQTKDQQIKLSKATAKKIVKDYVLKNASVFELARWETARRSALLSSKVFWSFKNPHYTTLALSDDLS